MEISRDPVGRLHSILNSLFAENGSIGEALAEVFAVDISESAEILRLYAELAFLVVDGKSSVRKLRGFSEEDLSAFLEPLDEVASVLSASNLNEQIYQLKNRIPTEVLVALKLCSRVLSRDHPEAAIEDEQIKELYERISATSNEILNASIDSDLKDILLQHLEKMLRAMREYKIRGASGLRDAIESGMGAAVIEIHRHPGDQSKEAIKKYSTVIGFGITLLDLGLKSRELLEPIYLMLAPK